MCIGSASTYAYDFEVNGIYYNYVAYNNTATVTDNNSWNGKYSGSISIPSSVTYNGKTLAVTRIGNRAFSECTNLKSVRIPNSIEVIERNAFIDSGIIDTLVIEDGNTYLEVEMPCFNTEYIGCTSFKNVYIGRGKIKEFGDGSGRSMLIDLNIMKIENLTIGPMVEHIGLYAHSNQDNQSKAIYIKCKNIPMFEIFPGTIYANTKVYVPKGTKDKYMSSEYWKNFFMLEEMDVDKMWDGSNNTGNYTKIQSTQEELLNFKYTPLGIKLTGIEPDANIEIFTIDGVLQKRINSKSNEIEIPLSKNEIYIVKIGNKKMKVKL